VILTPIELQAENGTTKMVNADAKRREFIYEAQRRSDRLAVVIRGRVLRFPPEKGNKGPCSS
jgi:hypothetical protein